MHNNRNNRETVIIPQTIIVPTKSIIVASLIAFLKSFFFSQHLVKNIYSLYNTHVWVVMVSCYQELTEDFFML